MIHFAILAASLYAIIGGPSVGKTSIIKCLKEKGHATCDESATDIIQAKQTNGIAHPWEMIGFEWEVFEEKVRREDSALKKSTNPKDPVFIDRGLLDTLVYLEVNGKLGSDEHKAVSKYLDSLSLADRYHAVFYVEPHNGAQFHVAASDVRHEDTKEALRLAEMIKQAYIKAGYNPITVPPHLTIEERTNFVLNKVSELHNHTFLASNP